MDFIVFFSQIPDAARQGDGFGVPFTWDVPLLEGYRYEVLQNVSRRPNVVSFAGCDTPEIYQKFRHGKFDAVIINGWGMKSSLQALWAANRLGIPCLVRGEANDIRPRPWWKRVIQRQLVHRYAGCLNIGTASRSFYLNRGVPSQKIFPAHYCVDNERLTQAASAVDRESTRRKFGLRSDAVVFLFCGKLEEKKHPMHLLEAMRIASKLSPNIELLIVGDGEQRGECEKFSLRYALPVRFAGFMNQSKIVDAYVASDCLVLPSDHGETWGLVVNEAMVCGRSAIISDQVGCGMDLVEPGVTGQVFSFGDCSHLANIMLTCAERPNQLKLWGEVARSRILKYSPAVAADGIWTAIETVCARNR